MPISSDTVHLHRLDLGRAPSNDSWRLLDDAERSRACRFLSNELRRQWTVARAGLRSILSTYCDYPAAQLEFGHGIFGKPVLSGRASRSGITFNLSHSGRMAVVAVGIYADLGIDVERKKHIRDWGGIARRFFSSSENEALMAVERSSRIDAFFDCWTRKEAVIKATGEGLHAKLDEFDVSLSPDAMIRVIADYSDEQKYIGWRLQSFKLATGYTGALATPDRNDFEMIDHGEWKL